MAKQSVSKRKPKIAEPRLSELAAATARSKKKPLYEGQSFAELENSMSDWTNTLKCAWHALNASDVVDGDEPAAQARNVIFACEKNLVRLLNDLEHWHMRVHLYPGRRANQGVRNDR